ncbi:endonuclease toxin domain-containing protein [Alkaliphilus transvaalensis]|uniref:endonuclease toxin domain-containing protein n=1 Tax=Alkaliphilus transvaalensis TaxID=114628 RepID=UPI000479AC49|nr:TadE/TadG family type IV pilus assembly protein [Alkaliphilus transvaalensis]
MIRRLKNTKGSVTVEAALVLPILICAVITIGFFSKIYYVNEIIHHAMTETANELSSVSYLYYVSGLSDLQEELDRQFDDYRDSGEITDFEDVVYHLMATGYDQTKGFFGNTIIKQLIKRHLAIGRSSSVDTRLKALSVVDGWEGLDFSHSSYLKNGQDIVLIVAYRMDLPLPIKFVKEIPILQQVTLRAWMGGSLPTDFSDKKGENEEIDLSIFPDGLVDEVVIAGFDVWGLPVFYRGREIKSLLNRNLHEDFPIIDTISQNYIVSIRTHDTRLTSNEGRNFYYSLTQDIRRLEEYTEETHQQITIKAEDYEGKILNVVIPYVALTPEQIKSLEDAKAYGTTKNIKIKVTVVK